MCLHMIFIYLFVFCYKYNRNQEAQWACIAHLVFAIYSFIKTMTQ